MSPRWLDTMRKAAEGRRELERVHGDEIDEALQRHVESSGTSRAARTYREAMAENAGIGGGLHDLDLPERILDPDETVYAVAVGGLSDDTFPLMIVTDRRVLLTKDLPWNRWKILGQAAATDVVGAELETRLLSGRIRVRLRQGKDLVLRVAERERSGQVVSLLQHLAAGGAPPR